MAWTRWRVNRAKRRHRARDVGDDHDLGLGRARVAELGVDRHAPGRQRVAHGGAEVERSLATVAALAGQPDGQLARTGAGGTCAAPPAPRGWRASRRCPRAGACATTWPAPRCPGRRPAGGGSRSRSPGGAGRCGTGTRRAAGAPRAAVRVTGGRRAAVGRRRRRGRRGLPGLADEALEDPVEVEVPQGPVEVVGAADRPARPPCPAYRVTAWRATAATMASLAPSRALYSRSASSSGVIPSCRRPRRDPGPAGRPGRSSGPASSVSGPASLGLLVVDPVLRAAQREVDLEGRLVGPPVGRRLHQAGPEGVLERLAVLQRDVAQGLGRVVLARI